MARKGDTMEHPVTGERFTFLETSHDTGGEYSRYEVHVNPHGFVAASHVHPLVEETFEILSGTWVFVVDGKESRVGPGEGATIPVGTPHAWWNAGDEEGVAIVEFRPALNAEEFFESFFGLALADNENRKEHEQMMKLTRRILSRVWWLGRGTATVMGLRCCSP